MSVNLKRFGIPVLMVFAALVALTLLLNNLTAVTADSSDADMQGVDLMVFDESAGDLDTDREATGEELPAKSTSPADATIDIGRLPATAERSTNVYIVVMNDQSLVRYSGGVAGLDGTSRQATGADKLDARAPESVRYLDYLDTRRAAVIDLANAEIGRSLDVSYEYGATLVGFAAEMTADEAAQIAAMADVAYVEQEKISYPQTDSGPIWSGASDIWGGDWAGLNYVVSMDGASQVSPVTTNVSGSGVFTYNFYTNILEYDITVMNPDGVQLTAMHIHTGTAGNTGGVVYNFSIASTTADVSASGSTTLSDEHEAALVNDGLYVNVHSATNSAGEVRGQIDLSGTLGEGVIVGIIDTGIDPWNPSFAAVGGDGYAHTNPLGSGTYVGVCDPSNAGDSDTVGYDATFPCNDKLIGAWGYTSIGSGPRDTDGHGSHTAGTTAGNVVFDSVIEAPTEVFTSDISGVAPHANIIAYGACCTGAALNASRDQALLDGVDVINYSIGSSAATGDFWQDSESQQWLALRDAGIFVATSNGNAGNGDATTGSPADLPWLTSVGANSHNRTFLVTVDLQDTSGQTVTVNGQAMAAGYGPADIVFSTVYSTSEDARLCAPGAFPAGTFSGEIVICERGTYGRVAKGQSVLDGGAGGFILAQPSEDSGGPGAVSPDTHELPAAHIDYYEYQILRQFVLTDAVGTVQATLSGASLDVDDAHGDIMASFSSRGPNGTDADLIVPSVTAPGRGIWAAYAQGDGGDGDYTYNAIQGTSMSSPHVAGTGALLKVLQPDWTPAEMQSALMLTARDTVLDDDGTTVATPFAQGSGHIDVVAAAASPLIMDVTNAEYLAADPAEGNDFAVRDLNTASFGEDACVGDCSWQRTVENATSETLTWTVTSNDPMSVTTTVSPSMFSLAPGEKQTLDITMDVSAATIDGEWRFGSLMLDEMSGNHLDTHITFAVLPSSGNIPETISIITPDTSGSVTLNDMVSIDVTSANLTVVGLNKADRHEFTLAEDNDTSASFPDIFFDDLSTTHFISFTVPASSFSAIAEIVETASPDLDLLLFRDLDGDGPELADATGDDFCQSASGGSAESCEILSPTAGTYYVAVINFSQVTPGGDFVDVATAVVPEGGADQGNMIVSMPATVTDNEPYTITVNYSDSSMTAIDKLYGYFTIGSSFSSLDDVATVRVDLEYVGIPSIEVTPDPLVSTQAQETYITDTLTLSTTGGVLDWNVTTQSGEDGVQDGSFEEGYADNPYWRADASIVPHILPICSAATCVGVDLATDGDWFVWFGGVAGIEASVEQDVTIPQGDVANLTFNMLMGTSDSAVATATLDIYLDNTLLATFTEADLAGYTSYSAVSMDVSSYADGGTYLLRMEYSNSAALNYNTFIDEVSIVSVPASALTCNVVGNIDWLSVSPSSGALSPGAIDLEVGYDAAGLAEGVYTDTLCINSNDPITPVYNLPVTMTVDGDPPEMSVDIPSVEGTFVGSDSISVTFTISNTGGGPLDWALSEVDSEFPVRAASNTYVEEGFEDSVPPTDWTVVDGDPTEISWLQSTTAYEGAASAAVFWPDNANPVDTWLISPEFDTGTSQGIVSFFGRGSANWCVSANNCDLDVWIVVGATAGDSDDILLAKADDEWTAEHVWQAHSYIIPPGLGTARIGFHVTAADGDAIFIDNVTIAERASICQSPSDISWVTASPTSGRIDPNYSQTTDVTFDSALLSNGTYTGTVCFTGNDPNNSPVEVPVTLNVVKPDPSLTSDPGALYGFAGDVFTHTVDLTNIGDITDTFDISITNTGWDMSLVNYSTSVELGAGMSETMDIIVTIPSTATYPMQDVVTVIATSQVYTAETDTLTLITGAGRAEPSASASSSAESATTGGTASYDVVLTNSGTVEGTFDIVAAGNAWDVSLTQPVRASDATSLTVMLAAGASVTVNVSVDVPANATVGDSDGVTLTMTSQADATLVESVSLSTTAVGGVPDLTTTAATMTGQLGDMMTYTVGISNTGTATGTFDITLSGYTWASTSSVTSTMALAPGAAGSFDVVVTIPATATIGSSDSVTVTAVDQTTSTSTDSLTLTTSVYQYIDFLPFLVRD